MPDSSEPLSTFHMEQLVKSFVPSAKLLWVQDPRQAFMYVEEMKTEIHLPSSFFMLDSIQQSNAIGEGLTDAAFQLQGKAIEAYGLIQQMKDVRHEGRLEALQQLRDALLRDAGKKQTFGDVLTTLQTAIEKENQEK